MPDTYKSLLVNDMELKVAGSDSNGSDEVEETEKDDHNKQDSQVFSKEYLSTCKSASNLILNFVILKYNFWKTVLEIFKSKKLLFRTIAMSFNWYFYFIFFQADLKFNDFLTSDFS